MILSRIVRLATLFSIAGTITAARCGSECGYTNGYPAFGKIAFDLDSCQLDDSWLLVLCRSSSFYGCKGLLELSKFSTEKYGTTCERFDWVTSRDKHYLSHFNSLSIEIEDLEQCNGRYDFDFDYSSDDTSGKFLDAKVLCNNDDIWIVLGREPGTTRKFQLYYETKALDEITYGYDYLSDGTQRINGKYCKALFPTMTMLLELLRSDNTAYDTLPTACLDVDDSDSSTNIAVIVVCVVGGVVVVVGIVAGTWWFLRRRTHLSSPETCPPPTKQQQQQHHHQQQVAPVEEQPTEEEEEIEVKVIQVEAQVPTEQELYAFRGTK